MKYIIKENQLNLLIESKGVIFLKEIIDRTLKHIQDGCDKSYDEFPYDISFSACDTAELVNEIKLLSTENNGKGIIILNVNIIYTSINQYVNFYNLIQNMERIIDRKLGTNVIIRESKQTNTKSTFDW